MYLSVNEQIVWQPTAIDHEFVYLSLDVPGAASSTSKSASNTTFASEFPVPVSASQRVDTGCGPAPYFAVPTSALTTVYGSKAVDEDAERGVPILLVVRDVHPVSSGDIVGLVYVSVPSKSVWTWIQRSPAETSVTSPSARRK